MKPPDSDLNWTYSTLFYCGSSKSLAVDPQEIFHHHQLIISAGGEGEGADVTIFLES